MRSFVLASLLGLNLILGMISGCSQEPAGEQSAHGHSHD
jgi:hypothetical protein